MVAWTRKLAPRKLLILSRRKGQKFLTFFPNWTALYWSLLWVFESVLYLTYGEMRAYYYVSASHSTYINLLLTEREGRTGEYWPEVVAVRTERSEVRTKTTEGQYSPVRLEQARLVSSLLYGTRVMLVSKLPAFENKKYTSYDHFHGNGPYGKIPTKKEPIRTPGFTPRLPCHIIRSFIFIFI